jgi:hypothetical protein
MSYKHTHTHTHTQTYTITLFDLWFDVACSRDALRLTAKEKEVLIRRGCIFLSLSYCLICDADQFAFYNENDSFLRLTPPKKKKKERSSSLPLHLHVCTCMFVCVCCVFCLWSFSTLFSTRHSVHYPFSPFFFFSRLFTVALHFFFFLSSS